MVWLAAVSVEVLYVATPLTSATGRSALPPSILNWTVPVGVPVAGATAETVAVKVTDWSAADGLADETRAVCDTAAPTDWGRPTALLPANPVSPLYTASTMWEPTP